MYDELIQQAREIAAKATQGPWEAGLYQSVSAAYYKICNSATDGDAAFIAASRTLVPQLCDALEAAEKEIDRLNKRIETLESEQCDSDHENMVLTARAEKAGAGRENREMKKTVILSRTAWDGGYTAWQEFMEIEIDVPNPPRPDMEWHVCGEKLIQEEGAKTNG